MSNIQTDKPVTLLYFSNEVRSQIKYLNAIEKKMDDVNAENRQKMDALVEKYKAANKEINPMDFVPLKQINILFQALMQEAQTTISRITYCRMIAKTAFGFDELDLTDKEKEDIKAIEAANPVYLFEFESKGGLRMKDGLLLDLINDRAMQGLPKDQKTLRDMFNSMYANYEAEKRMEEKAKESEERRRKQMMEAMRHDEEILERLNKSKDGQEGKTDVQENTEG